MHASARRCSSFLLPCPCSNSSQINLRWLDVSESHYVEAYCTVIFEMSPKSAKQDVACPVSEVPMKYEGGNCNQAATGAKRERVICIADIRADTGRTGMDTVVGRGNDSMGTGNLSRCSMPHHICLQPRLMAINCGSCTHACRPSSTWIQTAAGGAEHTEPSLAPPNRPAWASV